MRFTRYLAAGFAAATFISSAAIAAGPLPSDKGPFTKYGEAGDWTVWVDEGNKNCLIEKVFSEGQVVQMGLTKNQKHGYLGVFTTDDIKIRIRQKIEVDIDGQTFEERARGVRARKLKGDYKGGYLKTDDAAFANALAEGQNMVVFPRKSAAFQVDLTGTKKAMEMGRKCNAEQQGS